MDEDGNLVPDPVILEKKLGKCCKSTPGYPHRHRRLTLGEVLHWRARFALRIAAVVMGPLYTREEALELIQWVHRSFFPDDPDCWKAESSTLLNLMDKLAGLRRAFVNWAPDSVLSAEEAEEAATEKGRKKMGNCCHWFDIPPFGAMPPVSGAKVRGRVRQADRILWGPYSVECPIELISSRAKKVPVPEVEERQDEEAAEAEASTSSPQPMDVDEQPEEEAEGTPSKEDESPPTDSEDRVQPPRRKPKSRLRIRLVRPRKSRKAPNPCLLIPPVSGNRYYRGDDSPSGKLFLHVHCWVFRVYANC